MRHYDRFNPVLNSYVSLTRLTNRHREKTRKKQKFKPLKNFLVDGYVNFALCQSQSFISLSLDFSLILNSFSQFRLTSRSFIYIYYIYIQQIPEKKNVYIVCGPFTTECLGVVFFFLFVLINSSTRYPIDCLSVSVLALSLLIRVKLDNRGIQISKCWYRKSVRFIFVV